MSDTQPLSNPLSSLDANLFSVSLQLDRVPSNLFVGLEADPEHSSLSPLDPDAPESLRLPCSSNLDTRLQSIKTALAANVTPVKKLGSPAKIATVTPGTSVSALDTHPKHRSALLRLLFLHSSLNPANRSPHLPSLLIPLYAVLSQEVEVEDLEDLAHVEADTFWLFEAIIGEFAELEDEDAGTLWMKRLSDRLAWADRDLFDNLVR